MSSKSWREPRDPLDVYERITREPERLEEPENIEGASRGRPFTDAELDDYKRRGGIKTACPPDRPKVRRRPRLSKAKRRWLVSLLDVTDGLPEAAAILREHFGTVWPTSRRDFRRSALVLGVIKATLDGWTQGDMAKEWDIKPAELSRQLARAYKQWPKIKSPLRLLNLLNLQAKRDELPSKWLVALLWGMEKNRLDDARLQPTEYDYNPAIVKGRELYHRVFPTARSN